LRMLERIQHGSLDVAFPDGQQRHFGAGAPCADLRLKDWTPLTATLRHGDIGFAETYVVGAWTTGDLVGLLRFVLRNRRAAEGAIYGSTLGTLLHRLRHWLRRNTRAQAKRNIHAHYDLGNAFYALWLDPTMSYSSALFPAAVQAAGPAPGVDALVAGQHAKYARVMAQLQLDAPAEILEIGCGWGGFAATAARAGHRVTGLTLSAAQLEYAQTHLAAQALRARLLLRDYRDEGGRYDAIASIEMVEAVGERYWPTYFAMLRRCLKPGGRACVQSIVIDDALFARYRRGTDFIQQYVFPGGMLPSPSAFAAQAHAAGLEIVARHAFGRSYALTVAAWRERFTAQLAAVRALGFDEHFIRLWTFYLAYCEAAFAEGNTDVVQFTLVRR
jgi:cyclopropane-fatty-acyl-phospholipid synthase